MQKNPYPGKFIVFEGLDGAGKTTQIQLLGNYFKEIGNKIHTTAEPTQFLPGGIIHASLVHEWQPSSKCLQLLFAADRDEHINKEIAPELERGVNVVSDRYFYSSLAYGTVDCDLDWLMELNRVFLMPDMIIFLNVPSQECARRIQKARNRQQLFEKVETLEKVRQNYQTIISQLKKDHRFEIVDGNLPKDEVFKVVKQLVGQLI